MKVSTAARICESLECILRIQPSWSSMMSLFHQQISSVTLFGSRSGSYYCIQLNLSDMWCRRCIAWTALQCLHCLNRSNMRESALKCVLDSRHHIFGKYLLIVLQNIKLFQHLVEQLRALGKNWVFFLITLFIYNQY